MPRKSADDRIREMSFGSVYPLYVAKVVKKGRTEEELLAVIRWMTGYTKTAIEKHIHKGSTFETFFAGARLNPNAAAGALSRQAGRRTRAWQEDGEHPAQLGV